MSTREEIDQIVGVTPQKPTVPTTANEAPAVRRDDPRFQIPTEPGMPAVVQPPEDVQRRITAKLVEAGLSHTNLRAAAIGDAGMYLVSAGGEVYTAVVDALGGVSLFKGLQSMGQALGPRAAEAAGRAHECNDHCAHKHPPEVPTLPCPDGKATKKATPAAKKEKAAPAGRAAPIVVELRAPGRHNIRSAATANLERRMREMLEKHGGTYSATGWNKNGMEVRATFKTQEKADAAIAAIRASKRAKGWTVSTFGGAVSMVAEANEAVSGGKLQHHEYRGFVIEVKRFPSGKWAYNYDHGPEPYLTELRGFTILLSDSDHKALQRAQANIDRVMPAREAPAVFEAREMAPVVDFVGLAEGAKGKDINTEQDVYTLLSPHLLEQTQEHFVVLLLDIRQALIDIRPVAIGQRDRVTVGIEDLMGAVTQGHCKSFIVVHNHPSGDCTPSGEHGDAGLTKSIEEAFAPLDNIVFLDHLVLGRGEVYSFADKKKIPVH